MEHPAYPDPHGSYKALQEYVKAADKLPEADVIVRRYTRGTTSGRKDYQVMFVGEHVMLVKWRGGRGRYSHISGYVQVAVRDGRAPVGGFFSTKPQSVGFDARPKRQVWDLSTSDGPPGQSGRLVGPALRDLMAAAIDLDKHFVERRAVWEAEQRARSEQQEAAWARETEELQAASAARMALLDKVRATLTASGDFTPEEVVRVIVSKEAVS